MNRFTPSLSHASAGALQTALVLLFFMAAAHSRGQKTRRLTERENLGIKGPVRWARTTVARPNPDPVPMPLKEDFVRSALPYPQFPALTRSFTADQ